MARVLWLSDAGCTTGFGTVTHAIGDRLVTDYGHDISVLAVNYRGDHWPTPMKLYVPTLRDARDTHGTSRFVEMLAMVMPEVVVSLNDPLVLARHLFKNPRDPQAHLARTAPILAYLPIDGINYPQTVLRLPEFVARLEPVTGGTEKPQLVPVVMARHGNLAYPEAPLVYHGVDTEAFRPVATRPLTMSDGTVVRSKGDAKRKLEIPPDATLIVRVDRNSLRKNYADTVAALVPVMRRDPKVHAWFHCDSEDAAGIDLNLYVSRYPDVMGRFHWPGRYSNNIGWKTEDLVAVYNAGDVFVSTSSGEGFGLTLAEAAACGLPIVAQNVSAIPEVVGPGGILLEPERTTVPLSGQDNWLPNVEAFTVAIDQLIQSRGARRELGEAGRKHVTETFSWDQAARRFDALINAVTEKTSRSVAGPRRRRKAQ